MACDCALFLMHNLRHPNSGNLGKGGYVAAERISRCNAYTYITGNPISSSIPIEICYPRAASGSGTSFSDITIGIPCYFTVQDMPWGQPIGVMPIPYFILS